MKQKITKQFNADFSLSEGDRAFVAKITTSTVDRDKEVVLPQGMNSKDFESNPAIFWNHDYSSPPVAKATSLKRESDHWLARGEMATRPGSLPEGVEWFPDTLLHLMDEGIVNGVSVGIDLIRSPRKATPKDKQTFGPDVERVIAEWKLLEFSITPMPANQEALITAVGKGLTTRENVRRWFGVELPEQVAPSPDTGDGTGGFMIPDRDGALHPAATLEEARQLMKSALAPLPAEDAEPQKSIVLMVPCRPKPTARPKRAQPAVTKDNLGGMVARALAKRRGQLYLDD